MKLTNWTINLNQIGQRFIIGMDHNNELHKSPIIVLYLNIGGQHMDIQTFDGQIYELMFKDHMKPTYTDKILDKWSFDFYRPSSHDYVETRVLGYRNSFSDNLWETTQVTRMEIVDQRIFKIFTESGSIYYLPMNQTHYENMSLGDINMMLWEKTIEKQI